METKLPYIVIMVQHKLLDLTQTEKPKTKKGYKKAHHSLKKNWCLKKTDL